jgi:hypothetical protein
MSPGPTNESKSQTVGLTPVETTFVIPGPRFLLGVIH